MSQLLTRPTEGEFNLARYGHFVQWFDQQGIDDNSELGGKGVHLRKQTKSGRPVPRGFVVSAFAFDHFMAQNGLWPKVDRIIETLDVDDPDQLANAETAIKDLILDCPAPRVVELLLRAHYHHLGQEREDFAVSLRSSTTTEDQANASSAGQQESYLNITGSDNMSLYWLKVCASAFEARAIFYRVKQGQKARPRMAVVVQEMVQSDVSWVMFTHRTEDSNPDYITIQGVWGLGEGIVGSLYTPERVIVRKSDLSIVLWEKARQTKMLVRSEIELGNIEVDVSRRRINANKFTKRRIIQLARLALCLEQEYGHGQDMEGAYDKDGRLFLLQARALTTEEDVDVGDSNSNIASINAEKAKILIGGGEAVSIKVKTGRVRLVDGDPSKDPHVLDQVKDGDVLVASMTTPAWVPAMKRACAIVTGKGGSVCHAAIVSKELRVLAVVGLAPLLDADGNLAIELIDGAKCIVQKDQSGNATVLLRDGQHITVDGRPKSIGVPTFYDGEATERLAWYAIHEQLVEEMLERFRHMKTRTQVYVNCGELDQLDAAAALPVDGVGLARDEFITQSVGDHPMKYIQDGRVEEYIRKKTAQLIRLGSAFGNRRVRYRLPDFKTNEYRDMPHGSKYEPDEENPMIGFRGPSRYIKLPELFSADCEAIRRAREVVQNLDIMVPFCRTPMAFRRVKQLLAEHGLVQGRNLKIGMMVEVPSNILNADAFAQEGPDFWSVGSNDLTQLVLGVDRDSELIQEEFNELDPAVITAMAMMVDVAHKYDIELGICGEAPSKYPHMLEMLIKWGFHSISFSASGIADAKPRIVRIEQRLGILPEQTRGG